MRTADKNEAILRGEKEIVFYENKELTKKKLIISSKGIFDSDGKQHLYFVCREEGEVEDEPEGCGVGKSLDVAKSLEIAFHRIMFLFISDTWQKEGFDLVIPFDEIEKDLMIIKYQDKKYYFKLDTAILSYIQKNDLKKNIDSYIKYKDKLNGYLNNIISCVESSVDDCLHKAINPYKFEISITKSDIKVTFNNKLKNIISYFNESNKLIGAHGESSNDRYVYLCVSILFDGFRLRYLDENNYDDIEYRYKGGLNSRGACVYIEEPIKGNGDPKFDFMML